MDELKRYSWCHDEQKMIEDYLGAYVRQEEVLSLRNKLAKANEIISECWCLVGNDVDSKSALPESVNSLNERVKELEAKENLTILTNHEATLNSDYGKKWLNKFAIAKKVEALDEVESVYMQAAETSEPISFREAFDAVEEQLRKEQDNE